MTAPDHVLDASSLFLRNPLNLYRLTHRNFATLAGRGAAQFPGRWNELGEPALYTSTEAGTCVLERLVHTSKTVIPINQVLLSLNLDGVWASFGNTFSDRRTRAQIIVYRSLAVAERRFLSPGKSESAGAFAIAVPSVVAPVWNLVLYPKRLGFHDHVSLAGIDPYTFDPRLFPDNAIEES